jgi:MFS family permease
MTEFARSWRVLLGSVLGITAGVSSVYFYSLGIFVKPLAAEFGWGRGQASLGALVGTLCAAVTAIPVGRLVDRFGSFAVGLGSLALLGLAFAAMAVGVSGLASFIALTAVLSLLTAGSSPLPFARLVVASFVRHRGMALGLALTGTGIGAIAVPALLAPLVAMHGWRMGYFALAVTVLVLCLPIAALLYRAPAGRPDVVATAPLGAILRDRAFATIGLPIFLASIAVLGTVVHFVPMLTDAGLSAARAGGVAALIGVASIIGRLATGAALDRIAAPWVAGGLFAIAAAGLLLLALGGARVAVAGALITGVAVGAEGDLIAFLTARYFGQARYGQAYGALYALFLVGGAIGPALLGMVFDISGSYRLPFAIAAALLFAAALLCLRLSRLVPAKG